MRNFFLSLFRCFTPGSAYVVPVGEAPESGSVESRKLNRGVRQKSQLDSLKCANIEPDCLYLIETIRVDENAEFNSTLRDPTGAVLFSFTDRTISSAIRSPGNKASQNFSSFRMLILRTILRDFNDNQTENDTKTLVLATSSFLDSLERFQKYSEQKLKSHFSTCGSMSQEGLLTLTVMELLMQLIPDVNQILRITSTTKQSTLNFVFYFLNSQIHPFFSLHLFIF